MDQLSIEYHITDRGFTYAELKDKAGCVRLTVQCSSQINFDGQAASALRASGGAEWPGTSAIWLRVTDGDSTASVSIRRVDAAELAGILLRWLATGFIQNSKGD